jgi:hypothetical protein
MFKLFRGPVVFAGVVAAVFALSQVAFAGGVAVQTKQQARHSSSISTPNLYTLTPTPIPAPPVFAGQLLISEFRLFGPNGAEDEFIEIFNNSGANHTVVASGGTGYGVAASDGIVRCTIPNGTTIPTKGHFLCANSVGYSLTSYPAGNGTTATADATYTLDISSTAGIALFNTNVPAQFSLSTRLDAVGPSTETNTLYKEGTGYGSLLPFFTDHALYRDNCGKQGSITTFGTCPSGGNLVDTDNNANDFIFVDTAGTSSGQGQHLGAPGPENLSAPIERNPVFPAALLDPCVAASSPPNRVRDFTSDPANNSTFGTLEIRRTIINNSGGPITRLRFRIIDITTFPAPSGIADMRARSTGDLTVTVDRAPCGTGTSNIVVRGTVLEEASPGQQSSGGAFNSSLSAGVITLASPLANGASVDVRWLYGLEQTGLFKVWLNIEVLP